MSMTIEFTYFEYRDRELKDCDEAISNTHKVCRKNGGINNKKSAKKTKDVFV